MEKPILTIAVSSRALFDFEEENEIFKKAGEEAYVKIQRERLEQVAAPGPAFSLAQKLLAMNTDKQRHVEIIILSRNDPVTGLRVFRAIAEHKLNIQRGCFVRGRRPFRYLQAFGANLFLSSMGEDVRAALAAGIPAAHLKKETRPNELMRMAAEAPPLKPPPDNNKELRIAFDGDAVLFGDESERVYQEHGLDAFIRQEKEMVKESLSPGPLKPFLDKLHALQELKLPQKIRTALITSRGAPTHERPIRTLMEWGIEVDEAIFLSGSRKEEFIRTFNPDIFFDDQVRFVTDLPKAGHVPAGVMNESD